MDAVENANVQLEECRTMYHTVFAINIIPANIGFKTFVIVYFIDGSK